MEKFEHCITTPVCDEKSLTAALWNFYIFLYTPGIICKISGALFVIFLSWVLNFTFTPVCVAVFLAFELMVFPNYRKRMLELLRTTGIFDKECVYHFFENKYHFRIGDKEDTAEYSSFTGYFRFRNTIFLLRGKRLFGGCFPENLFEDKLDEFLACLEQSGVKQLNFFSLKHWLATLLFLAGIIIGTIAVCYLTL